jgi:fused signal recognition particle receptor
MSAFSFIVLGLGVALLLLIGAVARKMARGELSSARPVGGLDPGADADADDDDDDDAPAATTVTGDAAPAASPSAPAASAAESSRAALDRGLAKTKTSFLGRLNALFGGRTIDPTLADELEELLVTSDVGVRTATRLLEEIRGQLGRRELESADAVKRALKAKVRAVVDVSLRPLAPPAGGGPIVMMVVGVNGVGKTTTIGKLAARFAREGKKVVLGAGDTFRAAAAEQLEVWAERSGAKLVRGNETKDPGAVLFEAVEVARRDGADVCILDTAGRLHTKVNLMEELKKVRRVVDKAMPGAPHEVVLVLDATTGQNGLIQAQQFKDAAVVTSIALTKLDGTAKGGVVVAICDALGLPVRYVGVGEKVDDLRDFDPAEFVEALFDESDAA